MSLIYMLIVDIILDKWKFGNPFPTGGKSIILANPAIHGSCETRRIKLVKFQFNKDD